MDSWYPVAPCAWIAVTVAFLGGLFPVGRRDWIDCDCDCVAKVCNSSKGVPF
jgi:hypothetical protein